MHNLADSSPAFGRPVLPRIRASCFLWPPQSLNPVLAQLKRPAGDRTFYPQRRRRNVVFLKKATPHQHFTFTVAPAYRSAYSVGGGRHEKGGGV